MATISFTTQFDLTSNLITFVDTSDWAGQGIATTDVNGCFRIIAPSGTIVYNNTDFDNADCDIWIDNSLDSQQTIAIPLDGTLPESGVYSIQYSVYNSNTLETYTLTNSYNYTYVAPEVCITQTVDCVTPKFTSLDATDYVVDGITPTLVRVHKLYYPPGNVDGATFLSSAGTTIITGTFYQGTQTTTISTSVSYTFSDGLIVADLLEGSKEVLVDCTFICSIYCCIRALEQRMLSAKGTNNVKYLEYTATFTQVMGLVGMARLAIDCGKPDDVNALMTQIEALSECTSDCSCSGDAPTRVTGLGGVVDSAVVESGGVPVVVVPSTVGSVTTYTVSLSPAFVAIVNASYNTTITVGYGLSNTVTGTNPIDNAMAVSLVSVFNDETTDQSVTAANDVALTGIQVTATSTGTWLAIFEADADGASNITYRLVKNIGGTPVAMTEDRNSTNISADRQKMFVTKPIALSNGDTLDCTIDSAAANGKVYGRSITIVRIA